MSLRVAAGNAPADALIVTGICFGWFILISFQAVAAGFPATPFSDSDFIGLIAVECVFSVAALGYLQARGYDLSQLLPLPTAAGCLVGLALYAATLIVAWLTAAVIGTGHTAPEPIDEMVVNARISLLPLVAMSIVNGIYEEVFLLGYLQRALESFGAGFAIGASLLVRVLYHLYQGPSGALYVLGFGLVLGLYFAWTRKLWPAAFAHIFADFAGFSSF